MRPVSTADDLYLEQFELQPRLATTVVALQQDDAAQHVLELAAHEEGAYILLDDDGLVLLQEGAVLLAGDASADVGLSPTQGGVVSEQGTDTRGSTHTYACAHAHIHLSLIHI